MIEKPTSGDEEQRRHQTRVAREQSGLPPEDEAAEPAEREPATKRRSGKTDGDDRL